jgi:hypothetical protein
MSSSTTKQSPQVLVIPPMRSPTTGRMLGWTKSHAPGCYVPPARMLHHPWAQYVSMPTQHVPSHVGRCVVCGGGR